MTWIWTSNLVRMSIDGWFGGKIRGRELFWGREIGCWTGGGMGSGRCGWVLWEASRWVWMDLEVISDTGIEEIVDT